MSEPLLDQNQVDQQRRVILATRANVGALLAQLGKLSDDQTAYTWLGLADDAVLQDGAFEGTGTNRADYRAAIVSIQALRDLLNAGHGTNLAKFSL